MAVIQSNTAVIPGIYKMCVDFSGEVKPGQFFMLRAWDKDPLLSRPISVHDYQSGQLTFLYQVVGKGTEILATLLPGNEVTIQGPYGNGFPQVNTDLCVVGGGIGTAPLYYLIRKFKAENPNKKCRIYLGFRDYPYGVDEFAAVADEVILDVGGIITDKLSVLPEETVITCGPEIMMTAVAKVVPPENTVYVSLEAHMACGIGACLGCTCETKAGNKKVCKDGPVFERGVVFNV
ncbi:dihydroorotate dehydrogenase electron transfer subunit [Acetobacterium woodii]|uniref:Dihydroorotate dehydrogenase electron transfer subunit PyrK n=1 Tax=Acetobacterium woodii (strain ATCC 29683 / DSM 1030 / JCM 2381 / KCTC 1655 / WB1) TaxID=931626 RepID=H6LH63_ACEWD|nr:dihydroorotate dehydrogenase electron transfer subunit [Acetobacterium woodii]AFA48401.1 dihydroorotate dehydrogenase electron transfer subunit PyrK [Acetobacterium woodii DSM 1030]